MKINKAVQYGILFTLYLAKAGRCTVDNVAESLGLSKSFLEQVARKLRIAGLVKVTRGNVGGYSLNGNPSIKNIFDALSPVSLLGKEEANSYPHGSSEYRALAYLSNNLNRSIMKVLLKPVKSVNSDLVDKELEHLNSAVETLETN